jgi:hypothetical protein
MAKKNEKKLPGISIKITGINIHCDFEETKKAYTKYIFILCIILLILFLFIFINKEPELIAMFSFTKII